MNDVKLPTLAELDELDRYFDGRLSCTISSDGMCHLIAAARRAHELADVLRAALPGIPHKRPELPIRQDADGWVLQNPCADDCPRCRAERLVGEGVG